MKRPAYALIVGLPLWLSTLALALPQDRVVHIGIHEDPQQPASRIQYILSFSLSAQEQDGDSIGWEVSYLKITEKAILGSDTEWDVDLPDVDSSDGWWWVEHGDPAAPVRSDFVELPSIADTAFAINPTEDNLEFDIAGVPYTPPPGGPPYSVTAALDFAFTKGGNPDPEPPPDDSGDNEPVDVPDWPDDPTTSSQ